ncbi:MAG: tetratricopeptide repeat protein, partial [candidate division Zixibacteria bacterium]|nr:tetratricopeptide repeat protein [candidate division Zixibacteria bacterium]NIS46260.1 tetratricopeptide repeat protein [candidate division Zixibacteria bacterium]NIU14349.1 tetratricopeptide repeat protein [candidate division Zixibacteria bacterium]NIV06412.1 tetratricopeptide repeat protein [candidate division Zixibacteria bacterium]NIW45234.1 tetratricopeptide repeat protein [Gammaproteobacteria bacterium]
NIARYSDAENDFNHVVVLQSNQLTANYRLGLIWMARRDFQQAANYLETAITEAPEHRGVIKSLGYCYTWLGSYEKAQVLLAQIPESQN